MGSTHSLRVVGQILQGEETAVLIGIGDDLLGDLTLVVGVSASGREAIERVRQRRVGEDLALRGALPPGMKTSANPGMSLNRDTLRAQPPAMTCGTGAPSRASCDCRAQHIGHRELAEALVQLEPAVDAPRNRPRVGRVDGNGAVLFSRHLVNGQ